MKTPIVYTSLALAAVLSLSMPLMADAQGRKGGERANFETLDADGDGDVTIAEMEAAGAARFAEIDTDGSGTLTREELLAAGENQDRMERRIDRIVSRLDTNDNGTIEPEELGSNPERMAERFARLDTDGSGGISQEEFEAAQDGRKGGRFGKRGDNN